MVQTTSAATTAAHLTTPTAHAEAWVHALKLKLQQRLPEVKSSHLTEALASALGFNTNAALRAESSGVFGWALTHKRIDAKQLHQRLIELGYPVQADLRFREPAISPTPPSHYRDWLRELRELDAGPKTDYAPIRVLQRKCAEEFARTFGLGHLKGDKEASVSARLRTGADIGHCLPHWGSALLRRGGSTSVHFPGTDHQRDFFDNLPLSNGKTVEYQRAVVSLPYVNETGLPWRFETAALLAGCIGWTCTEHKDWSWWVPGMTSLVLFKRITPDSEVQKSWATSFKRWIVENSTSLNRTAGSTRRKVISDIADCPHLPFDLIDYDDCRERYLQEVAPHLYSGRDGGMAQVFERLMQSWATETTVA